jgi:hypothetical protein
MSFNNLFGRRRKNITQLFGHRRKKDSSHLLWKIAGSAALALVGAGVIRSLPDIKRYIRISTM